MATLLPRYVWVGDKLTDVKKSHYNVPEELTPFKDAIQYASTEEFKINGQKPI